MAWWLECATSMHFGWVQIPPETIFEAKGKNCGKIGNFGEISEKVGEISVFIGNFREKSDKRNFCAFFFSRLTEKRYFGEISAEKTEIFVHEHTEILDKCHASPYEGHFVGDRTT